MHKATRAGRWAAFDPAAGKWHGIAAPPGPAGSTIGGAAAALGGMLYFGGGVAAKVFSNLVHRYDPRSNTWAPVASMPGKRAHFACQALGGRVVVAGGSPDGLHELSSVEAYDPEVDRWATLAPLPCEMACRDSAVLGDRLHLTEGWHWPFHYAPRGLVQGPPASAAAPALATATAAAAWVRMPPRMNDEWTGFSAVCGGRLYVVEQPVVISPRASLPASRYWLKVYDPDADAWHMLAGPPVPAEGTPPTAVTVLGDAIVVVGWRLQLAIGTLTGATATGGAVSWRCHDAPPGTQDHVLVARAVLTI
eukprot:SM000074S21703  [mRNA]  locus=s74:597041:598695:+ [translate_table: standard]